MNLSIVREEKKLLLGLTYPNITKWWTTPMAARSKALICGRSLVGTEVWNHGLGMYVCLL